MRILYEYCQGCGKHPNEDIYGYNKNVFWVIDGATAVFADNYISSQGDVNWIVNELNFALSNQDNKVNLTEMLRAAITEVRHKAISIAPILDSVVPNELPTFAICIIRINEQTLEYICLGDCSVITSKEPNIRYSDNRILPFHYMVNDVKEKYKYDIAEYKKMVKKKVQEIKQYINTEDGYCIGTLDPDSALLSINGIMPIRKSERILLCSDGFQPNIDEAGFVEYCSSEYFDPVKIDSLIKRQRITEIEYFAKSNIDISDDVTVLLIEV